MPIYAYRCATCGHAQDVLQKMSDPVLTVCPACSTATYVKQVTAAGFQLKGSGWYVTDFREGSKAQKADGAADSGDKGEKADKSDGKGGEKAESKPVAGGSESSGSADAGKKSDTTAAASPAPAPAPAPALSPAAPSPAPSGKSGS